MRMYLDTKLEAVSRGLVVIRGELSGAPLLVCVYISWPQSSPCQVDPKIKIKKLGTTFVNLVKFPKIRSLNAHF